MRDVSIAPRSRADARIADYLERQARRVRTTPPGTCPLVVLLSMVQAAAAQTCGKCVPCRDGLPRLAALLERLVACEADEKDLEDVQALADTVRATSDCAIGYEAATALLDGLEDFADEVKSHLQVRACAAGVGQTVPCETLCPAHVDVPAYIALVAEGRYAEAVNVVRRDNPFPTACSFVCEHPCEQRCRRTLLDAPVNIRGIKRFAVDGAPADQVPPPPRGADTGRTVAVVGGGPSGLSCAYFLGLMGHRVTVFEAREQLGGMMRYGIPAYRFPRERLDEDVRGILNAGGITARCGMAVGEREMRDVAGTYDAVYVAIGAQAGKRLDLPGADAEGVYSAVELLGYAPAPGLGGVLVYLSVENLSARTLPVGASYLHSRDVSTLKELYSLDSGVTARCGGQSVPCGSFAAPLYAENAADASVFTLNLAAGRGAMLHCFCAVPEDWETLELSYRPAFAAGQPVEFVVRRDADAVRLGPVPATPAEVGSVVDL